MKIDVHDDAGQLVLQFDGLRATQYPQDVQVQRTTGDQHANQLLFHTDTGEYVLDSWSGLGGDPVHTYKLMETRDAETWLSRNGHTPPA